MRVALVFLMTTGCGCASAACLHYGDAEVGGSLASQLFAGPPNYTSIADGDAPQTGYLLGLPHAVCVDAGTRADAEPAADDVRHVQLVLPESADRELLRRLVGKPVRCRGRLSHAYSAQHHAPLLLYDAVCVAAPPSDAGPVSSAPPAGN